MWITISGCVRRGEAPERETFEGALKSGRMALENLGLGAYEARERADLFRRFNTEMVEEMAAMAEYGHRACGGL
jgi:hypothetical protein